MTQATVLKDRSKVREFRLTVKITRALETRVKSMADREFEGNFSALVRAAINTYLAAAEARLNQNEGEN